LVNAFELWIIKKWEGNEVPASGKVRYPSYYLIFASFTKISILRHYMHFFG